MPHNLYLHSALVQTRKIKRDHAGIKQALKYSFIDSAVALNLAFFVNAAILVLAAAIFFKTGRTDVAEIKDAHELLEPLLGNKFAPVLFAVALIAAGQSSTITGTLAGQIVMEGYLRLRINPILRRLLTRLVAIIPAVIVILINGEDNIDYLLVLSQVILSLQLGFAVIPLIHFVSDKKTMGVYAIKPIVAILAWLIASILVYLNLRMVIEQTYNYFIIPGNWFWKILILSSGLFFIVILVIAIVYPIISKKKKEIAIQVHPDIKTLDQLPPPAFNKIAVALEFSDNDEKLLSYALGQANKASAFILIHVVESVSANIHGHQSDDFETRHDKERLDAYARDLAAKGYYAIGFLGFKHRTKEIVRIVKENDADMLVLGAHGHTGIKDLLYGQTINSVRHELKIPVLVVNL
jgi:Mn2+ and Fe2+ transporters of the NRAMP family